MRVSFFSSPRTKSDTVLTVCVNFILGEGVESSHHFEIRDRFEFFTNAQNWQYCQLCISIYLQFLSLFTTYDVSNYKK